jgi:hypothetical protein
MEEDKMKNLLVDSFARFSRVSLNKLNNKKKEEEKERMRFLLFVRQIKKSKF